MLALGTTWAFERVRRGCVDTREVPLACPLPPDPPGLPFIGNVIGFNTKVPWLTYAEWSNTYDTNAIAMRVVVTVGGIETLFFCVVCAGDLVYTRLFGKHISSSVLKRSPRTCSNIALETILVGYFSSQTNCEWIDLSCAFFMQWGR